MGPLSPGGRGMYVYDPAALGECVGWSAFHIMGKKSFSQPGNGRARQVHLWRIRCAHEEMQGTANVISVILVDGTQREAKASFFCSG